jgi:hypothetical protein
MKLLTDFRRDLTARLAGAELAMAATPAYVSLPDWQRPIAATFKV